MTNATLTAIALGCQAVGTFLVAIDVLYVFREPSTIDIGHSGALGGGFSPAVNPRLEIYLGRRQKAMGIGLAFLALGFSLQGVAAWRAELIC